MSVPIVRHYPLKTLRVCLAPPWAVPNERAYSTARSPLPSLTRGCALCILLQIHTDCICYISMHHAAPLLRSVFVVPKKSVAGLRAVGYRDDAYVYAQSKKNIAGRHNIAYTLNKDKRCILFVWMINVKFQFVSFILIADSTFIHLALAFAKSYTKSHLSLIMEGECVDIST